MLIAYMRISTKEQSVELQRKALKQAGCDKFFQDTVSGTSRQKDRPGFVHALADLRKGDTLVVWKLDRLGRSVKGLIDLVNELDAKGIHFKGGKVTKLYFPTIG